MKLKDLIPHGILPEAKEDALALLRADHDRVEDLFTRFDEIKYGRATAEKRRLVDELCREFRIHTAIEEEIFYPALRAEIADDDLMNEARVAHEGARRLVEELETMDPTDELLNAKMHVLCAYIRQHVREEEQDMFPKAREAGIDLGRLAGLMQHRRQELAQEAAAKPRSPNRSAKGRPRPAGSESRAGR